MNMERITDIPKLWPRPRDANKGDFGKVLIVGGCRDFVGAPSLAANAALRSGAGLVTVGVGRSIQTAVVSLAPCATSMGLPEDEHGMISEAGVSELLEAVVSRKRFDVVAVGPGLGRARAVVRLIEEVVRAAIPLVVDADGLNVLAEGHWPGKLGGPCVITPHPGELSRLVKVSIPEIQTDREHWAVEAVRRMAGGKEQSGAVCLLKGNRTVVTNGGWMYINTTGNPGMATGGTGDVLTGVIAALVGQGLSTFDAAVLGSHVHGLAGDLAAEAVGEISLIASDLIHYLPAAFKRLA